MTRRKVVPITGQNIMIVIDLILKRRKRTQNMPFLFPPPHTEPKGPTRWSAVNPPDWLLHLYLADLLVLLLLLEVVVKVEIVE